MKKKPLNYYNLQIQLYIFIEKHLTQKIMLKSSSKYTIRQISISFPQHFIGINFPSSKKKNALLALNTTWIAHETQKKWQKEAKCTLQE